MVDFQKEEDRQSLFNLLNGPVNDVDSYPFMSYTESFADQNTDNEQDRQSIVDAIEEIFIPKSNGEWFDNGVASATDITAKGIAESVWNNPDFSTDMANGARSAAQFVNGATAGYALYAGVNDILSQNPANPNFEAGRLYTATAASVVAAAGGTALALNGSLAFIPFVGAALAFPVGAAIVGGVVGYTAYKLVDHYYDDIATAWAEGLLDTALGVESFVEGALSGVESVIEGILDDPNFLKMLEIL